MLIVLHSVSHNVTMNLRMNGIALEDMMKMDVNCLAGVLEREKAVPMENGNEQA